MQAATDLLLQYFKAQRFLFMAEQCLNLTKKCLAPLLRKYGLNHSQYLILMILRYAELTEQPVISTELAYLLGREKHTLTPLVESLAKRGYLLRRRGQPDRRAIVLTLSEKGKTLVAQVQPKTMDAVAHIRPGSDRDTRTIYGFLEDFRRSSAKKAGQDPALYKRVYDRLLVKGEEKLLELTHREMPAAKPRRAAAHARPRRP
jgi:DNA-binding MarR family transcriptional regulator